MKILEWWWGWRDRRRRAEIETGAFAAGRFVMYFWFYGVPAPTCFVPTAEEAEGFFRAYLVPWVRGELGTFHDNGPYQSPGRRRPDRRMPFLRYQRGSQICTIEIRAPDMAYRDRLEEASRAVFTEFEQRAEAQRTAQQAAHFTLTVAAMRDAHREIERGGQDPKGGEG